MFCLKNNAAAPGRTPRTRLVIAACTMACGWTWSAAAATPVAWHVDLAAARSASRVSQRPVLAIFSATWSEAGTRVEAQTLTDAGVAALIGGCFEPVLIDVDQHPELTRRLKIEHVPAAAIVGEDDAVLATFECPEAPAQFVATCGRAAQEAARRETRRETGGEAGGRQPATSPIPRLTVAAQSPAAGRIVDMNTATEVVTSPDARGSAEVVTTKVKRLASFAGLGAREKSPALLLTSSEASPPAAVDLSGQPLPATAGPTTSLWPAQQAATPLAGMPQQQATSAPTVAQWPARPASQPLPATIEPQSAAPAAAATSQPWLGMPTAAPAQTAAAAQAATQPQIAAQPQVTAAPAPQSPAEQPPAAAPKSFGSDMLAALKNPFGMFSRPTPSVTPPPTLPPVRPQLPAAVVSTTQTPDAYASMPLGLEGYCPVTLAQKGVWTEGRPQYGARHRGRTYLFAGAEQQQTFLSDPDRYAPALSGDDPVLAFESGKTAAGQRRYGVTYQSRMYLFSTPETRTAFAANPERYTTQVKLAEQPASTPAGAGTRRF